MFGSVPLNLETKRSAFLKNTSSNHAFFKVSIVLVFFVRLNTERSSFLRFLSLRQNQKHFFVDRKS